MARVIEGNLPEIFILPTWSVTFAAIDPTTGNNVAGVTVDNVSITGDSDDPTAVTKVKLLPPLLADIA